MSTRASSSSSTQEEAQNSSAPSVSSPTLSEQEEHADLVKVDTPVPQPLPKLLSNLGKELKLSTVSTNSEKSSNLTKDLKLNQPSSETSFNLTQVESLNSTSVSLISNQTLEVSIHQPTVNEPANLTEEIVPIPSPEEFLKATTELISTEEQLENLTLELSSTAHHKFHNLTEEFWAWKIQDMPQFATSIGINDDTAAHLDRFSPESYEQRKLISEDFLQRAQNINASALSEDEQLMYRIFVEELETYLQNLQYTKYANFITTRNGPQHELKFTVKKETVLESLEDYQKLLSRYGEFPRQTQEILEMMKQQIVNGLMPSNWTLVNVIEDFDSYQVPLNESVFYEPFNNIKINISEQQKEALRKEAEKRVLQDLLPSFKKLRDFFEAEYLPAARTEDGVSSLPGGMEFYEACLRFHTSTDLTPQQIHDLGISEVERIKEEVFRTATELGMVNMTLAEISEKVRNDPKHKFSSKEELLDTYRNAVYNVIYPRIAKIFNDIPDINVTVEENISGSGYASYNSPSLDGSRPGTFFINAKIYDHHKKYEVTALSLHEAYPGHHLQSVAMNSNPTIPEFLKYPNHYRYSDIPAKFSMHIAYSEGWGLYSEYLGNELGLYEDPYQRIGRHSLELLRACRLIADTGIHALGWTRQQAIDYLKENTFKSEEGIKIDVDRYIVWPGQACSYKIGEIKIKELRKKAETSLKDLFRVQDFHDAVLGCFGPLTLLEECIDSYITKASSLIFI